MLSRFTENIRLPLKLISLRAWRIVGWAATTILAVAALTQLVGLLFVVLPTGNLETNANLYINNFDYPVQFSRWNGGYILQVILDALYALGLISAWWFSYRAVTDLPLPEARIDARKRNLVVTHWHEAALMFFLVGLLGAITGTWQRIWLWNQAILPVFIANKVEFQTLTTLQLIFGKTGAYLNLANLLLVAGILVILFFEKLENPRSTLGYAPAAVTAAEFEEPPTTTSMVALQAIPGSMRKMPGEIKALPLRWWKRFVDLVK